MKLDRIEHYIVSTMERFQADDLLTFARVADSGSFSRAAQRLQLPKSTVPRRVAALERQLGERLLLRTTRKLKLTDLGQAVLQHARAMADEVDATRALAQQRQTEPSGRLRVSMTNDIAESLLAPMLAQFTEQHPQVLLELDLTSRRVDLVGEGFDLALRWGTLPADSSLVVRRICTLRAGLYAAPAYLARNGEPQAPNDLLALHALHIPGRDGPPAPWLLQRGVGDAVEHWQGLAEPRALANSPALLLQMAAAGLGVAAAAEWQAATHVQRGHLQRILPDWCSPSVPGWLVLPGRRLMPAKTRVFVDALERALAALGR